jgi:hypothetical protein
VIIMLPIAIERRGNPLGAWRRGLLRPATIEAENRELANSPPPLHYHNRNHHHHRHYTVNSEVRGCSLALRACNIY